MSLFTDAIANLRGKPVYPRQDLPYTAYPYYYAGREGSIELADGGAATYSAIYRKQPYVYAAVNKLARSVARTPIKVYSGPSSDRTYVTDGPLHDLLARPWKPAGTSFRLKERTVKGIAIQGVSIVVKMGMDDESSIPTEFIPAPSTGWTLGEDSTYIWTDRNGDKYPFERWQIAHTDFWDCDESGFGMSMLEPLRESLMVNDSAQRFARSAFKNGARPSSILKTDQNLKPEAAARLKEEMVALHGGVDNAFKIAVLTQGLDWANPPAANLDDAALIEHRHLSREEVATVFDVPQPSIGILDESNFASVEMFHTMLYQDSLGPWFKLIEESWQAQLVDMTPAFKGLTIEFDVHGLMRGADSDQYRNYATALSAGFMTPNEVRARENLPPSDQPDADQLLFPLNHASGAVGAQLAEDTGATDNAGA